MKILKSILAFLIVNVSIIVWITIIFYILSLFWIHVWTNNNLLLYSIIIWFVASFISLLISKYIINWQYNIKYIKEYEDIYNISSEYWIDENKIKFLYEELNNLKQKYWYSNIELWIYKDEEPNAFAFWCWICWRWIVFSTNILNLMNEEELLWVLWHEFSHINNWDVVSMTILQWFLNVFVIYISRILANLITSDDDNEWWWILNFILVIVFEILFWILASIVTAYYSRIREFKADEWSAKIEWKQKMIEALQKLQLFEQENLIWIDNRKVATTFKIDSTKLLLNLFATHPPLESRIKNLLELNIK